MIPFLMVLALAAPATGFEPAQLETGGVGDLPYGAQAAGLVVLAADVDTAGRVSGIETLKDLTPFGDVLRESVTGWSFDPARSDGQAVETPVLVIGVFRPAMLLFPKPPVPSAPPADVPDGVPYPTEIAVPGYPANAVGSAYVLVEADISADGSVDAARVIGESSGFDDAALASARGWRYRPARSAGRAVPARAYLLYVFRQPA